MKLIPAVCKKKEIIEAIDKLRYSTEIFYFNGTIEHGRLNINEDWDEGQFQWAICDDNENLVGYIGYKVSYYDYAAYNFGLISFDKTKPLTMASGIHAVLDLLKEYNLHRIEFRAVEGNPAVKHYDKLLKLNGKNNTDIKKHILTDVVRDTHGDYHDAYIYEILIY